ncbi:hypothetical protein BKA70DRAFT_1375165 [Coprinopsis sp. MPI-PUGE-AT-0042]|nr:hypothetical protein BKA70DRAFT_1375165 [Coprinopsis sp. MPI-PUGE-AT-0042]
MNVPGISPELMKRPLTESNHRNCGETVKPDPVTGELDDSDLLTSVRFFDIRELERQDDPDIKALQASVEAERVARESAINFETFDFSSLPRIVSVWRVTLESVGLVDPSTDIIVEPHEADQYPEARPNFQLVGWVPNHEPHRLGQMDRRYIMDVVGIPKNAQVVLSSSQHPFSPFQPGIPHSLAISTKLSGNEAAISPFLNTLPGLTWNIESAEAHGFMQDLIYSRAKRDYEQHIAAGTKAKELGNKLLQSSQPNQRSKAINAYTESLRRFEDAMSQKVMEDEKKAVMKLIAIVCANRSFAYCKEGIGAGRDHTEALGDLSQAKESIARGLRLPQLQSEPVLVETLIELQTGGKGVPEDDQEFLEWSRKVLNDPKMRDIKGKWREALKSASRAYQHSRSLLS